MAQPLEFTLSQQEYEALVALARRGCVDSEGNTDVQKLRDLEAFLRLIEKNNGVTRDAVWVQWQELDAPLPAGTNFPDEWPVNMRAYVEYVTRAVNQSDVEAVLEAQAKNPTSVLVTRDPGARVGWTPIDDFFR